MLRGVVFDVDGTLVDSVDLHARCWQEAFARYGRQIPFEKIRGQIGKGGDQLIPYFLPADDVARWVEELDSFRADLFQERYLPKVRPFPKVRALFERIRQAHLRIALASSAKDEENEHYIQMHGIGGLVEGRTTSDDAERSKPHPDIFEAALEVLALDSPSEASVVGDSPFDAEAAGRLTLPCIGLLSGGLSEADLRSAGCRWLFRDPADLFDRFERLAARG